MLFISNLLLGFAKAISITATFIPLPVTPRSWISSRFIISIGSFGKKSIGLIFKSEISVNIGWLEVNVTSLQSSNEIKLPTSSSLTYL